MSGAPASITTTTPDDTITIDKDNIVSFLIGIILALSASALTQGSNVLVAYAKEEDITRRIQGRPELVWYDWQHLLYFPFLIGGAACDAFALGLLPQSLWSALSCLQIIIYTGITKFALNTTTSARTWTILWAIVGGVLLTSVGGPGPTDMEHSAVEQFVKANWHSNFLMIPLFWIFFALAYYKTRRDHLDVISLWGNDDDSTPAPTSLYNLCGTFCAAIATLHFQTTMAITLKSLYPFHWGVTLSLVLTGAFISLHFHCLWFMMEHLHIASAVPCYIIMLSLFHAVYSYTIYNLSYSNPALYILGIHTMVVALIAFMWVSELDAVDAGEKMSFIQMSTESGQSNFSTGASNEVDEESLDE